MTSRTRITVVVSLAAWGVTAVIGQPQARLATAASAPVERPPAMGLSGCAARGCHGGPTTDRDGKPLRPSTANSCTVWLRHDRHANAYRTLLSARSKAMIRHLGGTSAETDIRCLACHVTPSIAEGPATAEVARLRADGVGCDACHTAPGHSTSEWVDAHKSGAEADLARCYRDLGLLPLTATRQRAEVCAGCHIGAPASPGIPVREVTHDLIAAGHPRLNFDYATFLALMPPHWSEPQPIDPVAEWFEGKVTASRAALRLVADQASRGQTWPELAAFNCAACHHALPGTPGGTDWRQQRFASGDAGKLPWSGIPYPLHKLLPPGTDTEFAKLLARLASDPGKIRTEAESLSQKLANLPAPTAEKVLSSLHLESAKLDWDDASQVYYALAAVNRGRASRKVGDVPDTNLRKVRDELRKGPTSYDPATVLPLLQTAAKSVTPPR